MDRRFSRAFCAGVVAALLAACSNSQPPFAALGTMPQSGLSATQVKRAGQSHGYNHTLLYVTSGEAFMAYDYPKGKSSSVVAYFAGTYRICADKNGNVFLSTSEGLLEYPHDGANAIATFGVTGACSVDPVTGSLAVCGGDVAVFPYSEQHGWLLPKERYPGFEVSDCGYDNQGNLFVAGRDSGYAFQFAELPAKSKMFTSITLDQSISEAGPVQWDGSYITLEDAGAKPSVLYRFSIAGSTGQTVGSTVLKGTKQVYQYWIQGNKVSGSTNLGVNVWPYPAGENP